MSQPIRRANAYGVADIDLRPFQERYRALIAEGHDTTAMALRGDFVERDRPDTNRLKRVLGLRPQSKKAKKGQSKRGEMYTATHCTETTALRLCKALELDPVDVGL